MSRSDRTKVATNAITPEKLLTSAVAQAGTFTLDYPSGYTVDDFAIDSPRHILGVGAAPGSKKYYSNADDFTLAFGASSITVTWKNATSIPANSYAKLQLDLPGAQDDATVELVLPSQVRRTHVVEIDLGAPDASSATYFRAAAAIGGAGALTLLQTTLDVPRNIIITNAGDDTGDTYVVTGTDEYGATMIETITGANAGVAAGVKAFKTVSSIVASGASAGNVSVGFGDVLGLPIWIQSSAKVLKEEQDGAAATAGTLVAGLARATQSTATTADVRGTYDPNAACDAAKRFQLTVVVEDPTYKGNPQYDG